MERLISIQKHSDYLHSQELMSMSERWDLHRKRVNFGRQKLSLEQFVPCKLVDGVWVVLEEPVYTEPSNLYYNADYVKKYQEAKDRVLFEGFELNQKDLSKLENIICITKNKIQVTFFKRENSIFLDNLTTNKTYEANTIEDLVKYNLELTPMAKKQIGL